MTAEQERYFKSFLDHMFDHIMDLEERALHHVGADDLSVRELHVLDAVGERMADGRNTMTGIADGLWCGRDTWSGRGRTGTGG